MIKLRKINSISRPPGEDFNTGIAQNRDLLNCTLLPVKAIHFAPVKKIMPVKTNIFINFNKFINLLIYPLNLNT